MFTGTWPYAAKFEKSFGYEWSTPIPLFRMMGSRLSPINLLAALPVTSSLGDVHEHLRRPVHHVDQPLEKRNNGAVCACSHFHVKLLGVDFCGGWFRCRSCSRHHVGFFNTKNGGDVAYNYKRVLQLCRDRFASFFPQGER